MKIDDHVNLGFKNMLQKKNLPWVEWLPVGRAALFSFFFLVFQKKKIFWGGWSKLFFSRALRNIFYEFARRFGGDWMKNLAPRRRKPLK